jgi:NADH:ubiquinone oxidoreductase subunit 4 (subunit M)
MRLVVIIRVFDRKDGEKTPIKLTVLAIILCFLVNRAVLFFISFEFIMLPMALAIFLSKAGERFSAIQFFFGYTMVFSLTAFLFVVYFSFCGDFDQFKVFSKGLVDQRFLVQFFFVIVFAVKFPVLLLHSWLPRAHVEASTLGSVILAACLLKLGSYGLIRFFFLLGPSSYSWLEDLVFFLMFLALLRAVVCLFQTDIKALVAYSSVVHMTFLFCGICCFDLLSLSSNVRVSVSHGYVRALMFFLVGGTYGFMSSRSGLLLRGSSFVSSWLMVVTLLVVFLNCGLPISLSFMSEILVFTLVLSHSVLNSCLWFFYCLVARVFCYILFSILSVEKSHTRVQYRVWDN